MNQHQIDIFVGNCPLCEDTVERIQKLVGTVWQVSIYNLQDKPDRAKQYNVKAVPAIAINGRLALTGKPTYAQLETMGLRQSDSSIDASVFMGMGI